MSNIFASYQWSVAQNYPTVPYDWNRRLPVQTPPTPVSSSYHSLLQQVLHFAQNLFGHWDSMARPSSLAPSPPIHSPRGYDSRHGFPKVEHFHKAGNSSAGPRPEEMVPPGYHWRTEGQRRTLVVDGLPDVQMQLKVVDGTNQWVPTLDPKKFAKLPSGTPTLFEGENPPKAPRGYVYEPVRGGGSAYQLKPEGMSRVHMRQTPLGIIPTLHHEMPNA